jgi:hypothetical protein
MSNPNDPCFRDLQSQFDMAMQKGTSKLAENLLRLMQSLETPAPTTLEATNLQPGLLGLLATYAAPANAHSVMPNSSAQHGAGTQVSTLSTQHSSPYQCRHYPDSTKLQFGRKLIRWGAPSDDSNKVILPSNFLGNGNQSISKHLEKYKDYLRGLPWNVTSDEETIREMADVCVEFRDAVNLHLREHVGLVFVSKFGIATKAIQYSLGGADPWEGLKTYKNMIFFWREIGELYSLNTGSELLQKTIVWCFHNTYGKQQSRHAFDVELNRDFGIAHPPYEGRSGSPTTIGKELSGLARQTMFKDIRNIALKNRHDFGKLAEWDQFDSDDPIRLTLPKPIETLVNAEKEKILEKLTAQVARLLYPSNSAAIDGSLRYEEGGTAERKVSKSSTTDDGNPSSPSPSSSSPKKTKRRKRSRGDTSLLGGLPHAEHGDDGANSSSDNNAMIARALDNLVRSQVLAATKMDAVIANITADLGSCSALESRILDSRTLETSSSQSTVTTAVTATTAKTTTAGANNTEMAATVDTNHPSQQTATTSTTPDQSEQLTKLEVDIADIRNTLRTILQILQNQKGGNEEN